MPGSSAATTTAPPIPQPAEKRVFVAGLWRRLLAAGVDAVLLAPVLGLTFWLALRVSGATLPTASGLRPETVLEMVLEGSPLLYGGIALGALVVLLYGGLFMAITGATVGLRLLGLKVINVYGQPPEIWRVVLRCGGFIGSCATLGLGFLWIGFDREKRGLADWLAGTYVIRRRPSAAE